MPPIKNWLAGSYQLASTNASCQRAVNLIAEALETNDKQIGFFKGRPGLASPLVILPTSPIRGMFTAGTNLNPLDGSAGRLFAVAGARLYEVFANGTYTDRGDVGNDGLPVQMFGNGNQLGIVSNLVLYVDNGAGPVLQAANVFSGVCDTMDQSGTASVSGTTLTWISATSGVNFGLAVPGDIIYINGQTCHVAFRVSGTVLTLVESLPVTASVTYAIYSVQWASGDLFSNLKADDQISIGGNPAISIKSINPTLPTTFLNLKQSAGAGTITGRAFTVSVLNGLVHVSGNTADWVSGDTFNLYGLVGQTILLNGDATRHVTAVASTTSLTFSGGAMADDPGVSYGINPAVAAGTGAFLDSYFIVAPANTKQMNVSTPGNGAEWDPADVAYKESYPDNIGRLFADHEELYVMGEVKSEVWRAPGVDLNFPFQRDPSANMPVGIAAPASMSAFTDGVAWVGGSLRGQPVAYFAKGYQPERISTHAIEQAWKLYTQISDAVGTSWEMDGHEFWQISFPTADKAWVYDRTASLQFGKPMWCEFISFDGSANHRFKGVHHAYVWNKHWMSDITTGRIYELSSEVHQDNSQTITCTRVFPHLCEDRLRQFFHNLRLDMETGGGVALTVVLEWSDDGGHNFVGGGSAFTWTTSTTLTQERVVFWQLGSADDRVWRLSVSGNARVALLNAFQDVTQGT